MLEWCESEVSEVVRLLVFKLAFKCTVTYGRGNRNAGARRESLCEVHLHVRSGRQ